MIVKLLTDESGNIVLPLNDELCVSMNFNLGDEISLTLDGVGGFIIGKVKSETELVMVETVSVFRHTYVVEVPKGKKEWALDSVVMEDVREISQEHIAENIASHRIVSRQEALEHAQVSSPWFTEKMLDNLVKIKLYD